MARPVTNSNTPLLNSRYSDNVVLRKIMPNLPTGACNFTNLSIGSAARCGCQRFCDRAEYAGGFVRDGSELGEPETTGWCMCEHHACFHEQGRTKEDATASPRTMPFQRQISQGRDASLQSTYQGPLNASVVLSQEGTRENNASGILENGRKKDNEQMSTMGRLGTGVSKGDGRGSLRYSSLQNPMLPDIPSQCLLPSNISSGDIAGGSLSFGSVASPNQQMENKGGGGSIQDWIPQPLRAASLTESLTDVASPMSRFAEDVESRNANMDRTVVEAMDVGKTHTSMASKPSSQAVSVSLPTAKGNSTSLVLRPTPDAEYSKMDIDADSNAADLRRILPHASDIYKHYGTKPSLNDTLQNHEDRLDHLENATHSCVAVTETDRNCDCDCDLLSHKHEIIEWRMDRVEKALASKLHRGLGLVDDGNASIVSEISNSVASTGHSEMYSRIDSRIEVLESRVNTLDNSVPPSASHPWEFDVIFLPFGTDLNRVWTSHGSFSSQASRYTQETTSSQALTNASAQRFFTKASKEQSWEHLLERYNAKADLYSGRVCGIDSIVNQRLRSRGLVRTIEVKGPDAQHVHFAMFEAFGGLLQEISVTPFSNPKVPSNIPRKLRRYREALNGSWIPLRKLHKDSRLRFLETSEMVTSTLWTPSFLAEIAMQQSGRRRLYITNKDSYLQHASDSSSGWTWEKIRQLPHYSEADLFSGSSDGFNPSHSARPNQLQIHELCWDWNEKLDGPENHHTVTTQHPSLSIRGPPMSDSDSSSSSAASSAASYSSPLHSHTPASEPARPLLSPLTERNFSHPFHARTTSMPTSVPTSVPLSFGPSQSKRRIACFEEHTGTMHSPSSSPLKSFLPLAFAPKRQRTRSPSRPRDTPRWSTEPPSPYVFEEEREHKRGLTPFAYATPFSNAPYNYEPPRSKGDDWGNEGDGSLTDEFDADKDRNEEYESDNTDQVFQAEDEAWEGVRDREGSADEEEEGEDAGDDDNLEATALSDGKSEDAESETNSTPSEYPSTQPVAMYAGNKGTFEIHVDDDEE